MAVVSDLYNLEATIMLPLLAELIFQIVTLMLAMELIESIAWVALGFLPTIVALEVAWKINMRRLNLIGTKIR